MFFKHEKLFKAFIFFIIFAESMNLCIVLFYATLYAQLVLKLSLYKKIVTFMLGPYLATIFSGFVINAWVDRKRKFGFYFSLTFLSHALLFISLAKIEDWKLSLIVLTFFSLGFASFLSIMQSFITLMPKLGINFSRMLAASSLGWAIGGLLGGWIFDPERGLVYFNQSYLALAFFNFLLLLPTIYFYSSFNIKLNDGDVPLTEKYSEKVAHIWKRESPCLWRIFLVITCLIFARSTFQTLYNNFYLNICHGSVQLNGLAIFLATIFGAIASYFIPIRSTGQVYFFSGIFLYMLFYFFIFWVHDPIIIFFIYTMPFYVLTFLGSSQMLKVKSSELIRTRAMGLRQNAVVIGRLLAFGFSGVLADGFGLTLLPLVSALLILFLLPISWFLLKGIFKETRPE
ncbi:hypothetical protein ACFL35_10290 [Candidatus Riflebacteria bacterium]